MSQTYPTLIVICATYSGYDKMYVTATKGGKHAPGSYHYKGQAVDVGADSQAPKDGLANFLYRYSRQITELIHSRAGNQSGWYVKNGQRVGHAYYGPALTAAHVNHVHFAIATQAEADEMLTLVVQDKLGLIRDGVWGPKTAAAVKAFQGRHGLVQDGKVGLKTADRLSYL